METSILEIVKPAALNVINAQTNMFLPAVLAQQDII
jgi:hypothetical protein